MTGEPGIGKTRLLAELAARSDANGYLVLSGSGSELERELPFGLFVDALDEYVYALDPRRLELLDEHMREELAQVFPSLSEYGGARAPILQEERYRIHRAVRELLEGLASSKPLVLVLDDLHWADSGSIELLGALVHRPPSGPVLLALAARPRHLPEKFSASLERAHRTGTLARLKLDALTREQAFELVGAAFDKGAAATLFEESGGNPLYLEQLARSFGRTQVAPLGPAVSLAGIEVPAAVAAALGEELALLSDDARRVLEGAAVAGDPFEPELAAAAAGVSEAAAIGALDELLGLDLIRSTDVPRRFAFRHPLVRRAVYEATPGGWRLSAHERSAAALAARGASAAARAHHVEHAGRHGDEAAIAVLREAGEALAQSSPAGAARWFAAALRLLPETAPPKERVALLTSLAGSLAATGQFEDARTAFLASLELVPDEDPALRVGLTVSCAGVEQLLGRHAEARARLENTLETLDDPTSPEAVALMISLALDSFFRPTLGGWKQWVDQALELAAQLGNRPLQAAAASVGAALCSFASEVEEGHVYRERAAALVDAMPDDELAARVDAVAYLCGAEAYLERFDDAITHGERGLSIARATAQGALLPTLVPAWWTALWMRGRLEEGAELLEDAIEAARLSSNNPTLVLLIMDRSLTAGLAGDVQAALALAHESWELAQALEEGSIFRTWSGFALGAAHLEQGDYARAVEVFYASAGGEELDLIPGVWRALALAWVTSCWVALERQDEAERSAVAARAVAAGTPLRLGTVWADRASAAVAQLRGDWFAAAEAALRSAAIADEVGAPIEGAMSRRLGGRALADGGERVRATEELERAAAAFDECGALRYRDEAERELRKLGRRTQRTPRGKSDGDGLASLTERELQVARLVMDRKTNPEIAAELFLSSKTVETHLRHIFGKLGVSSRVEVARVVENADGLAQGP